MVIMGRKPGMPFPHLEPTRPYWPGFKVFLAKATEPSDLDLDLVQRWFVCFVWMKLKVWMAMKIFQLCVFGCETNDSQSWISQTAEFPFAHWCGLLCQGNCEFTVMASLKCKEVEKGMCDPEKCKNISDIRHNLPMSRSLEFWIQ